MIGRRPFDLSPYDLLPEGHQPATTLADLSPADRVFGWVRPRKMASGSAAYRGQLHVGPVICQSAADEAIQFFDEGPVPLAILGTPKPTQARFYVHTERDGRRLAKGDWYADPDSQKLNGRKFFVHHNGLGANHWSFSPADGNDPTQQAINGRYREYLRSREPIVEGQNSKLGSNRRSFATKGRPVQDTQNRSITGWVEPGISFTFDVEVRNLNDSELGALLWLLGERVGPNDHPFHHRLGYGKPLGFGSIELTADLANSRLSKGGDWADYWSDLDGDRQQPDARASVEELRSLEMTFEREAGAAWPEVLDAFLAIGAGDDRYPVHYPRVRPNGYDRSAPVAPDPQGRAYQWFVENERKGPNRPQILEPGLSPLSVHAQRESQGQYRGPQKKRRGGQQGRNRK
jgi:CRISPR-associated protein (TIGR03986 family)